MTDIGDVLEMPDGHLARVISLSESTMLVEYDDNDRQQVPRTESSYMCKTCGATVEVGEDHPHNCPVEGDTCGARRCNETGLCQA